MIVVTTDYITGRNLDMIGLVQGSCVMSKHIGKDIGAGFKTLVGGEIQSYTEMMDDSRRIALDRMVAQAQYYNADAVVNVRFASAAVMQGAAEVLAYGTAVKFI